MTDERKPDPDLGAIDAAMARTPTAEEEMRLRDEFAMQAIHCFQLNAADVQQLLNGVNARHDLVARFCYGLADAMLAARRRR